MTNGDDEPFFPEPKVPNLARGRYADSGRELDWLDRSTLPEIIRIREFLNRSLGELPPDAAANLAHRFRRDPPFARVFFELVVGRFLQVLGATVEHQPVGVGGVNVDWRATFPDGAVYVEATSPTYNQPAALEARRRVELVAVIETAAPEGWWIARRLPNIALGESRRAFRDLIRSFFADLPDPSGYSINNRLRLEATMEQGSVVLDIWPGEPKGSPICMVSMGAHYDDSALRVAVAAKAKRTQARAYPGEAVLLAIDTPFGGPDVEEYDRALFGTTAVHIGDEGVTGYSFQPDGALARQERAEYAAVLAFPRVSMFGAIDPIVYHHPRFDGTVPAEFLDLRHRFLEEGGVRNLAARRTRIIDALGFAGRPTTSNGAAHVAGNRRLGLRVQSGRIGPVPRSSSRCGPTPRPYSPAQGSPACEGGSSLPRSSMTASCSRTGRMSRGPDRSGGAEMMMHGEQSVALADAAPAGAGDWNSASRRRPAARSFRWRTSHGGRPSSPSGRSSRRPRGMVGLRPRRRRRPCQQGGPRLGGHLTSSTVSLTDCFRPPATRLTGVPAGAWRSGRRWGPLGVHVQPDSASSSTMRSASSRFDLYSSRRLATHSPSAKAPSTCLAGTLAWPSRVTKESSAERPAAHCSARGSNDHPGTSSRFRTQLGAEAASAVTDALVLHPGAQAYSALPMPPRNPGMTLTLHKRAERGQARRPDIFVRVPRPSGHCLKFGNARGVKAARGELQTAAAHPPPEGDPIFDMGCWHPRMTLACDK